MEGAGQEIGDYIVGLDASQAEESLDNLAISVEKTVESLDELGSSAESNMETLAESADSGASSLDGMASSAQAGGRGIGQIGGLISMFNPAGGKMVMGLAKAATAFKGLTVVMNTFGKKLVIITAIVAAVGLAYSLLTRESDDVKAANEALVT